MKWRHRSINPRLLISNPIFTISIVSIIGLFALIFYYFSVNNDIGILVLISGIICFIFWHIYTLRLSYQHPHQIMQVLVEAQAVAHLASWTADLQKGTFGANAETSGMLDWIKTLRSADDLLKLADPADQEYVQSMWRRALEQGNYDVEYRVIVNGTLRWLHIKAKIVFNQQKQPTRAIGILQDITERKQTELALYLSEERYRKLTEILDSAIYIRTAEVQDLYENAPNGYHSLDSDGKFILVNQTELTWLGYSREEMIGRSFTDFITPESQALFQVSYPLLKTRGWVRGIEYEFIRKDSTTFYALLDATAIYDAQGNYVMSRSTIVDNSERKKAEDALRESEEQNRLLFEESPDSVVLFDHTIRVVRMNRAFTLLTGYAMEEIVGKTLVDLHLVDSVQIASMNELIGPHLKTSDVIRSIEFRITCANGEIRDVGMRAFKLNIHSHPHYLATFRDITAEKQVEETLRCANNELARAARTKDEFLANMSHELRTPLNAILGLSEGLLEEVYGPFNERQVAPIRNIETSGRHLLSLINDILDLSKVEAGRLDLHVELVSVVEICQASLAFVREMASKKALKLNFCLDNQMAEMIVDPKRLKQMLVNLLSNAVKFTRAKGHVELRVTVDTGAGIIRFAVQDTGIGIAPEDMGQLFQPFRQLDSSLNRQHEGTGLGLVLVRRLAELQSGSISVESTLGEGSCFTIALPYITRQTLDVHSPLSAQSSHNLFPDEIQIAMAARDQRAALPRLPRQGSAGITILLVEDNEINSMTTAEYLEESGYTVIVARNGREALERAKDQVAAIILMDIQMPEMDGLEATRRLRLMPHYTITPIIALTALAMPGDRERCLAAGANEYLTKPVSLKILVVMIQQLLTAETV